jgi:putative transposase
LLKHWCREEKLELCGDWKLYLKQSQKEPDEQFERHTRTGRPLGDKTFITKAEKLLNRDLRKKKPGPKVG